MKQISQIVGTLILFCTTIVSIAEPRTIVGTWGGTFYDLDLFTADISNPLSLSVNKLAGLEYTPDGTLYGLLAGTYSGRFYKIDDENPNSTTLLGSFNHRLIEGGLAYDPRSGAMYVVTSQDVSGSRVCSLYTIDLDLASTTDPADFESVAVRKIGDFPGWDPTAIAVDDRAGTVVVYDTQPDIKGTDFIFRLSTTDASVISLKQLSDSISERSVIAGMDYDPTSRKMYLVGGGNLYTVDADTGQMDLVASGRNPWDLATATSLAVVESPTATVKQVPVSIVLAMLPLLGLIGISALRDPRRAQ